MTAETMHDPEAAPRPETRRRAERLDRFPADFLWGAATSAYQVEGSPLADGAGESIWTRFARIPGRTFEGATGDIACDHYHRYRDDVELMRTIGLGAYRFSIAWARVLPEGRERVNPAGLDFYSRLVDTLLEHGIVPCVTLYHWDLPAALDDAGGWLHADAPAWFAEYAQVVFRALGDRVSMWTTLNEPWVVAEAGYLRGVHAPGHRSRFEAPRVAHNLLLAHAEAVRVFRSEHRGRIGIVVNLEPKDAASDAPADRAATARADAAMNRHYLDALFFGAYPEELPEVYGSAWPRFRQSELDRIRAPIDFLGINYYTRSVVRYDRHAPPVYASPVRQLQSLYTETGWEVHPASLERVLLWVRERYGHLPLYVTENGAAFPDPLTAADERVHDPLRVDYLRAHLGAVLAAMGQGVDLRGYFVWSLLDNLEWASGFAKRFGLVHVEFETQKRTLKSSAEFYRDVIRTRGRVLGGLR